MPYQIKCDGYIIFDTRDDALIVDDPKINLEVNTVGEGSFTIHKNHPYYDKLRNLKSVFEVSDDIGVIFRGRMTGNSCEFYNSKMVDLEGAMGYFNDSVVRPYAFPEDFMADADYIAAADSGNVIEFFLNWLIEQHNEQVQDFQQFKLGNVTVADPNNYLSRSDSGYPSTWETLKSKLFDSSLGGYLCIRYEADGNYIDYVSGFDLVNTQQIVFGENLLDLKTDTDTKETYSAIIPLGADGLTIKGVADGDITDDIVKQGDMIYSRRAVEAYGFIVAPVSETTWDDVTDPNNLLTKGAERLAGDGILLTETIEVSAVDMHFTDKQVQSFRIYRNVNVKSIPHGHSGTYMLPKLALDLENPENTRITIGTTRRTLTDINSQKANDAAVKIESAVKDIEETRSQTTEVLNQVAIQSTELANTCTQIVFSALESYVETGNFEQFKSDLKASLEIWAGGILGRVSASEERIENVNGDLQAKFNQIVKYFTFDINGLTIGQVDNPNRIVIDNDDITIYHGERQIQTFKADGSALIPQLSVTEAMNLLGLNITADETHINCDL